MDNQNKIKGIEITRIFDAPLELVWKTWTDPELIKKWWGPRYFTAPIIEVDLKEGGEYHYCMRGPLPDGKVQDLWSKGVFQEITPMKKIVYTYYFSNEAGDKLSPKDFGMSEDFPEELEVTVLFEKIENQKTKLTIKYPKPDSKRAMDALLASRMEEGWSTSLDKFAESLV